MDYISPLRQRNERLTHPYMKKIFCIVLTSMLISGSLCGQQAEALKWLVGTWTINTANGYIIEQWNMVDDSTFQGKSVFVNSANDSILQEVLELSFRRGEWTYYAQVVRQNNNKPIPFRVTFVGRGEFISENPTHDFPQRIAYRRVRNSLFASIEGINKGRYSKQNFDYSSIE
jgi:hypothetical protein